MATAKSTGKSTGKKRGGIKNLILWKPGQSGNPRGKKLGTRNRKTVIIDAIKRIAEAQDISAEEIEDAIQAAGIQKAIKGSFFHYQEISNGLYGKITDKVDVTSGGKTLAELIASANDRRAKDRKTPEKFRSEPEYFHYEVLGYEPWERQLEISHSIRDNRNTAIRSCNGAGKTFHVAREGLRFLYSYYPAIVINTAPVWTQVENQYWRYLRDAYNKAAYPLGGKLLKTQLDIQDNWFAMGLANDPDRMEAFQGWHAENIMVIFDEASGIAPKIYEAALGAMAGGRVVRFVLIGNPTQNSGPFFDAFKDPTFNKIRISANDVPNVKQRRQVVPGLVTHEWVEELALKYGVDSDIYRVRVEGQFPMQGSNTLISVDRVERAVGADREWINQDDDISGLDVARFGDDDSALVRRQGNKAAVQWVINGNNTMELAGKAAIYLRANPRTKLYIDITGGLGAGVFDRLREQPDIAGRVYGVNVAAKPRDEATYINIRIESWFNVGEWLRDAILEKHEGFYQLAQPIYKITSNGKMQLESKEDMKKRGVKSPDIGDALALTLSKATEGSNLGVTWI